MEIYVELEGLI